jgi:hypothetical protein
MIDIGAPRMGGKSSEPKKTVYRDSKDGQFRTQRFSENNPDTTEKERVRIRPPEPPKKK